MIDRVSEIRTRWQRVDADKPPQKRRDPSRFALEMETEPRRERASDGAESEDQVHISVRI